MATNYHRFVATARELYGLDYRDAVDLYAQMKDVLGYAPDEEDAYEYADIIEAIEEPEYEEEYREPPEIAAREVEEEYEPEEEMWEEGTEFELTATTEGGSPARRK